MFSMGRVDEVRKILESSGISTVMYSGVEPDPPIELIERVGKSTQIMVVMESWASVAEARWILQKRLGLG